MTQTVTVSAKANTGSFRDPGNRVYEKKRQGDGGSEKVRIFRGLDEQALLNYTALSNQPFFQKFVNKGQVVKSEVLSSTDEDAQDVLADGWCGVLEHESIPFVSYPYEWTFSMLKDAALLQLDLIENSLENGWTLKDATPYNVQWVGARPVFIDIPSFEPWVKGEPWVGYRQFCTMFLTPLMLKAHLDIDPLPLLRSYIDGIPPIEAAKYFYGLKCLKKGVLSHIVFPAKVENSINNRERDDVPAKKRAANRQSKAMVVGLVQSLSRLIRKLSVKIAHTDWSEYDQTHTYQDACFEAKKAFVYKHVSVKHWNHIWDIGCNTGTFSRIANEFCHQVISIDGDHNAVEKLYLSEKQHQDSQILPLVMNLSNISPGQGWDGRERQAFDQRNSPDFVLCLALIHHVRISANIPNALFLRWLRKLNARVILEFVNREDEMVVKLLTNKKEQYEDYNINQFIQEAEELFTIEDRECLKGGKRELLLLIPK